MLTANREKNTVGQNNNIFLNNSFDRQTKPAHANKFFVMRSKPCELYGKCIEWNVIENAMINIIFIVMAPVDA